MDYKKICEWISARPVNLDSLKNKENLSFNVIESLPSKNPNAVCFFFSLSYKKDLIQSTPGLLITGSAFIKPLRDSGIRLWNESLILEVDNPYLALAQTTKLFAESLSLHSHTQVDRVESSIHPLSVVDPSCKISEGVVIHASCVVEKNSVIGKGVILYPGVYVGPNCVIGEGSVLFPKVTLYEKTQIGKNTRIHAGVVIGADGFGYAPKIENTLPVKHEKIYHFGNVTIGDDVEIGANTCIDRGTMGSTVIGAGTKIDNHVQIGHNVKLGKGCIVCGNVGIAGSTTLGDFVTIAGMTAINNKVKIGDYVVVGPFSGISKDVKPGARVRGYPQKDERDHLVLHSLMSKMLEKFKKEKVKKSNKSLNEDQT